jgi:hypothetical protein
VDEENLLCLMICRPDGPLAISRTAASMDAYSHATSLVAAMMSGSAGVNIKFIGVIITKITRMAQASAARFETHEPQLIERLHEPQVIVRRPRNTSNHPLTRPRVLTCG